jgi:hypothetical protein
LGTLEKGYPVRKLSIVIPVLGRLNLLEHSLVSILENRPDECEVLVVLNSPYDDPYALAGEVEFVEAPRGAGLIESLATGVAASRAPIVHVLACGVEVSEGWVETPLRQFKDPSVAAVAPLVLDRFQQQQIVSVGVGYRKGGSLRHIGEGKRLPGLGPWAAEMIGPSLLAGYYRKSVIEQLGGWDERLGAAGAAADMALGWKQAGLRTVLDPQSKVFAPPAARQLESGTFAQAMAAERMFLSHVAEGEWTPALLAHLFVAAADVCGSLPRPASLLKLLGRTAGWLQYSACRRKHREFLQRIAEASQSNEAAKSVIPRPHLARFGGAKPTMASHREAA